MSSHAGVFNRADKGISAGVLFLLAAALYAGAGMPKEPDGQGGAVRQNAADPWRAGIYADFQNRIFETGIISPDVRIDGLSPEEKTAIVYTFLQGPKSFKEGRPWSGSWCEKIVRGNSFGGFGCGFCCMANIYGTMTKYECSPWDMYEYALGASSYYPSRESGAIGWDDMKSVLRSLGFACEMYRKPGSYEEFQEQMKNVESAIVLVSSAYDDTFWKNTSGHYVNIWLYREDRDEVFLAEPGDPENNRTWIPLRYVYDALKEVSPYQYLAVTSYEEEGNAWKWDGISDAWNGRSL